jgi:hypothetical protein
LLSKVQTGPGKVHGCNVKLLTHVFVIFSS